ncbi:murein biosynthesis integral membrane protein MurJ [Planococcus sp. CAU13]|uniref:murein biosynthesis integral membrane protein MurJ n=1 Tax=Planococcus sp. CAU13 TaxID=1541197 RepID=UPI00052FEA2B|nr:lipid II flippase MurJ [Planococcus sp. CAU13]
MSKLKIASILFLLSTFILKFSSMLRDLVIAGLFGDSYRADAYIAAMTIPNALVLFMLTGMKDAFLPSYYKFDAIGKGEEHLTNIAKGTMWICLILSIGGMILAAPIVRIAYPSFAEYEDGFFIATWTIVIYFASLVFVGINAVYEGYFDAHRKFSFSVFSQTSVVLMTIVFALLFHNQIGILAVPIGYFVGTIVSLMLKLLYRTPKKFMKWKQPLDKEEVRQFYLIFWPVGLTIAVGQINLMVNTFYAAGLEEGVVANLNYAFRLINIPQAIFGVTIATIAFPIIARAKVLHDMAFFRKGVEKGLLYMLMFITPTLAGMWLLMEPLVEAVYERGAFTPEATMLVSSYAILYIGSTFFYSIQAVVAKGFYTLEKGHLMMRIGLGSILLNIISNYIFSQLYGAPGIALSASLVGMFYSIVTFSMLWKLIDGMEAKYLIKNSLQIAFATAVMLGILVLIEWQTAVGALPAILHIAILGTIGAIIYFAILLLFKNEFARKLIEKGGNPKSLI